MRTRHVLKASLLNVWVELMLQSATYLIVAHVLVERIESEEPGSPACPVAVHENHQVDRSLPARDGVRHL